MSLPNDPENVTNVHDPDSVISLASRRQGALLEGGDTSEGTTGAPPGVKLRQDYPENFADYPKSISERRADVDDDGSIWAVRDVLIRALRDLDSGVIPPEEAQQCLVIFQSPTDAENGGIHFYQKTPTRASLWALLARMQRRLMQLDMEG